MLYNVEVVYFNGTSILENTHNLPEDSEVEFFIQATSVVSPLISDVETKKRFLESLIERMQHNQIPFNAPHLTREMLHE